MIIVHVFVDVKPESVEAFKEASIENARHSIMEPGIVRFDLAQEQEAPHRFILIEIYRTPEDILRHKETSHYQRWRDTVEPMMATPRHSIKYAPVHPTDEEAWEGSRDV